MKKNICGALFVIFLAAAGANAQTEPYVRDGAGLQAEPYVQNGTVTGDTAPVVFFLSPYVGLEHGQIQEHVFCDIGNADLYQLSRLDWDMDAFFKTGVQLDAFFRPVRAGLFFITAAAETAIPGKTGIMQDYDWQELDGILTDYSKHTNNLLSYARFSTEFAWRIPGTAAGFGDAGGIAEQRGGRLAQNADGAVSKNIGRASCDEENRTADVSPYVPNDSGLTICAGGEYIYYSFSGTDGYAQHAYDDDPDVYAYWSAEMDTVSCYGIDYILSGFQVFAGLSYKLSFTDMFSACLSARFYPYLALYGDDTHYPDTYYLDILSGCGGWSGSLETSFKITARDSFCILLEGEYYPPITGNTYTSQEKNGTYVPIGLFKGYQTYGGSSRWNIGMKVSYRRML